MNQDYLAFCEETYINNFKEFHTIQRAQKMTFCGIQMILMKVPSKGFHEKPQKKSGARWTEERREKHRERMKEIWEERKNELK